MTVVEHDGVQHIPKLERNIFVKEHKWFAALCGRVPVLDWDPDERRQGAPTCLACIAAIPDRYLHWDYGDLP